MQILQATTKALWLADRILSASIYTVPKESFPNNPQIPIPQMNSAHAAHGALYISGQLLHVKAQKRRWIFPTSVEMSHKGRRYRTIHSRTYPQSL